MCDLRHAASRQPAASMADRIPLAESEAPMCALLGRTRTCVHACMPSRLISCACLGSCCLGTESENQNYTAACSNAVAGGGSRACTPPAPATDGPGLVMCCEPSSSGAAHFGRPPLPACFAFLRFLPQHRNPRPASLTQPHPPQPHLHRSRTPAFFPNPYPESPRAPHASRP